MSEALPYEVLHIRHRPEWLVRKKRLVSLMKTPAGVGAVKVNQWSVLTATIHRKTLRPTATVHASSTRRSNMTCS